MTGVPRGRVRAAWLRHRGAVSPADSGAAAASISRLAVLLEAGLAPSVAWRHLAEATTRPQERDVLTSVAEALRAGGSVAAALAAALPPVVVGSPPAGLASRGSRAGRGRLGSGLPASASGWCDAWLQVAAAWQVAEQTGAPLAPTLRVCAEAARDLAQARRDAAIRSAGPRASARIVLALPAVGVGLAMALGVDAARILLTTPAGWGCLVAATALVAAARAWNGRLLRASERGPHLPGFEFELVAVGLSGGGAWAPARARAREALERYCPGSGSAASGRVAASGDVPPEAVELDAIALLSERAGAPGVALLRAAADDARRDARASAAIAAERLGVQLMVPLGVCILPAFVLVGVVPLGIALFTAP